MNTPNPLVPQGSFQSKGKSTVRIAFFTIAAIHVVFIGGLLMQGCKKPEEKKPEIQSEAPTLPPITEAVTNLPATNDLATSAGTNTESNNIAPSQPISDPVALISGSEHVVVKGDSFSSIAKNNHVSVRTIEAANPGVSSSRLKIGQKLQIPASSSGSSSSPASTAATMTASADSSVYVVKSGDVLEKIARRNGTTAKKIMTANNLRTTMIKPGQKLKIPSKAAAPTEPATSTDYVTPLGGGTKTIN